jgi:hypothetical protein
MRSKVKRGQPYVRAKIHDSLAARNEGQDVFVNLFLDHLDESQHVGSTLS